MSLSTKRLYFVMIGVAVLAFATLLGGAYGADALLKYKSKAVHEARLENLALEEEGRRLAKAKADIAEYQSLADIADHIVPQDKDQAQTVREIVGIAAQHSIKLGAITFPSSTLGDSTAQYSQLAEVEGLPGVLGLDITIQSDSATPATYTDFLAFLDALEHNRRTALVKDISLQPNPQDSSKLSFSLTLKEYVKP